ncbi:response regulator [Spirosoma pollinicola]|uniref:Response regulator n=1 Tax=Spirosoma pollinicola TaxID=2057025 RepID=A0A2K8Z8Q9_9BACT|nr:response regulator [Spirosoma pollinicola]AUD06263.1 response regulator [Spirosoma pollinicola]
MNDSYPSQSSLRGTKILLIDDTPQHCILIQKVMKVCMPNVELLIATTGEQAKDKLNELISQHERLPRLILLDLYLPRKDDGWTLLQHLKATTSPLRLIPVTLLSHSGSSDDIQTSYHLGANSYIVKPLDYPQWMTYFESLSQYWLYTVAPPFR